jgi:hypothetical protein
MILNTPETRKINTKTGVKEFKIIKIERAEDWPTADKFEMDYLMSQPNSKTKIRIPMKGISLSAWEKIEADNIIPQVQEDDPDEVKDDIAQMAAVAENKKTISLFEEVIGQKIPGESFEEKISFLNKRNAGEIDAIKFFIRTRAGAISDGSLIGEYLTAIDSDTKQEVIQFTGFDDWKTATESKHTLRIHRPFEDYIVEFPVKGLSQEKKQEITERTKEPKPPMVPARSKEDPRRFDRNRLIPNRTDPSFLQQVRAANQLRTAMYFNECMMFTIPGGNEMEQYNWIASHLIGDVLKLKNFIEDEIANYMGYYDFFTNL